VAPHISLIMVGNLGSMRWALILFKCFRSVSGLSHSCLLWLKLTPTLNQRQLCTAKKYSS